MALKDVMKHVQAGAPPRKGTTSTPTNKRTTAINVDGDLLRVLRQVALDRSDRFGGRASVSALVNEFLRRHQAELEAMATTAPPKKSKA